MTSEPDAALRRLQIIREQGQGAPVTFNVAVETAEALIGLHYAVNDLT